VSVQSAVVSKIDAKMKQRGIVKIAIHKIAGGLYTDKDNRKMKINFSTTQINYAKDYLERECYGFLSEEQRSYILGNLGDIRIQDPMMYPNPRIEIHKNIEKHKENLRNEKEE